MRAKLILGFLLVVLAVLVVNVFFSFAVRDPFQSIAYSAVIGLAVGLGLGVIISANLTRELSRLSSMASEISEGDLSREVVIAGQDEISQLGASFNKMARQLREIVGNVQVTADVVSRSAHGLSNSAQEMTASAQEIASATEHVAKGAEYQAEFVEKSSGRIQGMASAVEVIADRAGEASKASTDAGHTAKSSGEATGAALGHMKEVFEDMDSAATAVQGFGERLQRVGKIVEVISGISQQTNLLALNATIEAARAGEYGKGFGVVAEEVRKLSEKTKKSAEEITDLIKEIGTERQTVLNAMAKAAEGISSGREVVNTVAGSQKEIIDTTVRAAGKVEEISIHAQEQVKGAVETVKIMEEISKIAEDNAAATEEASAATQELTAAMEELAQSAAELQKSSEELSESITRFKT
jgi:methyl-accepting chemotaxis protein